jgi:hypothetical protein
MRVRRAVLAGLVRLPRRPAGILDALDTLRDRICFAAILQPLHAHVDHGKP